MKNENTDICQIVQKYNKQLRNINHVDVLEVHMLFVQNKNTYFIVYSSTTIKFQDN